MGKLVGWKLDLIAGIAVFLILAGAYAFIHHRGYTEGEKDQKALQAQIQKKSDDAKIDIKEKQDEISNNRPSVVRVVGRLRAGNF